MSNLPNTGEINAPSIAYYIVSENREAVNSLIFRQSV